MPPYQADHAAKLARVAASDETAKELGWQPIEKPTDMCVVGMSCRGAAIHHVGVYLAVDGGKVLHATSPRSIVQKLSALKLQGYHTIRFYEYKPQSFPSLAVYC